MVVSSGNVCSLSSVIVSRGFTISFLVMRPLLKNVLARRIRVIKVKMDISMSRGSSVSVQIISKGVNINT